MEQTNKDCVEKEKTGFKRLEETTNNLGHKLMNTRNEVQKLTNLIVCGSEELPETKEKAEERPRAENRIEELSVKIGEYAEIVEGILKSIYELKGKF